METNPTPQPKTQLGDRSDGELKPPFKVADEIANAILREDAAREHAKGCKVDPCTCVEVEMTPEIQALLDKPDTPTQSGECEL